MKPKPLDLGEIKKEDIITQAFLNSFKGKKWDEKVPLGDIHLEALKIFEKEIKQRIKIALQGLLQEIEQNRIDVEVWEDYRGEFVAKRCDDKQGEFVEYETLIKLIKKYFAGVLEDKEATK